MLNVDHPANRGVLSYLGDAQRLARSVSASASRTECTPADISNPYYTLGTHPDLVTRLWDELAHDLPVDCRCVVFGTPALVRPDSGVLFGFAGGTHTYAFRLPPDVRVSALAASATTIHCYPAYPDLGIQASVLDLGQIGDEWLMGGWFASEATWCAAAYEYARG